MTVEGRRSTVDGRHIEPTQVSTFDVRLSTFVRSNPIRIGVLASGRGTNLQAILDACVRGEIPGQVVVVISNIPTAGALARARRAGVPAILLDHREFPDRQTFEARLTEALHAYHVDLICLAGWLRVLSPGLVNQFSGRIMNIHPALLPAFGGHGMYGERVHRAVLKHGVKVSGCTVHFVDESTDGGPIILQAAVAVQEDDTPASLAARIARREHRLYLQAVGLFAEGRLQIQGRKVRILDSTDGNRGSGVGLRDYGDLAEQSIQVGGE